MCHARSYGALTASSKEYLIARMRSECPLDSPSARPEANFEIRPNMYSSVNTHAALAFRGRSAVLRFAYEILGIR